MLIGLLLLSARASVAGAQGSARIDGTVFDSLRTQAPLGGATVVLVESNRYVTADERGRFQFDSVAGGRWSLAILHPMLDSLDLQLPRVSVEVREGQRTTVRLATPSANAVYGALCGAARAADAGAIVGRVRDVDTGTPVAQATVRTSWTEFVMGTTGLTSTPAGDSARTNADGLYVLCDVPLQSSLDLRATRDGQQTGTARVEVDTRIIVRVDLALSLTDPSARDASLAPPGAAPRGRAQLSGRILGLDQRGAADALVVVTGTSDTVRTDAEGRFRVSGLAAGTRTVEVRAIGAQPATILIELPVAAERDTTIQLTKPAQELQKLVVRSTAPERSPMAMSGFAARQRIGLGAFVTAEQLAPFNYPDLASVLRTMRGISVELDARGRPLPLMRGMMGARCIPFFFIDNTPMTVDGASPSETVQKPFSDVDALVPPLSIKGIEVYSNAGGIPPQYDQTALGGCGSIVIWTR
jgi:hypothetical protein